MHKALYCTCCQIPPHLYFYFHHRNQLLCSSVIDVIFPIFFCCNNFYCIFVCPHNLLLQHTFFSLCICVKPSIMLSMSSPLASSIFVYGIRFLLHSLQFYPTSHKVSLISIFPLPLHPYFLALGCSIACSFFILFPLCPILCTLIVIVLAVFFILFDTVTPAYVVVMQLPLNCFG